VAVPEGPFFYAHSDSCPPRPPALADSDVLLPAHVRELIAAGVAQRDGDHRGRFAPSPTGPLHHGNLRTALLSWLVARLQRGEWLLRIDDLDQPRNRPGAEAAILADLAWLGLHWDGPVVRQSQRRGLYATVLSALRRAGVLYPCRCSRRLLADVSAPHGGLSVYPGFCRQRPMAWGMGQGRLPSWRLALPAGALHWQEAYGAPGRCDGRTTVGDIVVRRADGVVAYHLATAVDELTLGIGTVVRGADLWASTAAQVAVMAALGQAPPRYGHVPLWRDGAGLRLSKREGAQGLEGDRAAGRDAATVVGRLAASLGLVPPGSRLSAEELLAHLDPQRLDQALAKGAPQSAEA